MIQRVIKSYLVKNSKRKYFTYQKSKNYKVKELPPIKQVISLKSQLAQAAQKIYDDWVVTDGEYDELNGGGICHLIADAMCDVLYNHGIECQTVSSTYEVHVYVVLAAKEGVFEVDIRPWVYETGGGYSWKKIEEVTIDPNDVLIEKLDSNPREIYKYVDF